MPDRVDPADAEQVVDEGTGARAAGRDAHPLGPDEVGDLGDSEEVGRVAEGVDDREFVVESVLDLAQSLFARPGVAAMDRGPASLRENGLWIGVVVDAQDRGLGQVDRAQADVGPAVEGALGSQGKGVGEQAVGAGPVAGDLEGPSGHGPGVGEVPGVGDPVEVALVEDDEAAGGVEDVGDGGILTKGVTHRTGEDHDQPGLVGEVEQGPGLAAAAGCAVGAAVEDDLDRQRVGRKHLQPTGQRRARPVGTAGEQGPADVAVRPEQHPQPRLTVRSGRPAGDEGTGGHRGAALTGEMGVGDQPAQGRPPRTSRYAAPPAARQHRHPGVARVDDRAAADRRALPRRRAHLPRVGTDGEIHAQDRQDARRDRRRREPHRTVEPVPVGERERWLAVRGGPLDEGLRGARAVPQREAGGDVKVGEVSHRSRIGMPRGQVNGSGQRVRSVSRVLCSAPPQFCATSQ